MAQASLIRVQAQRSVGAYAALTTTVLLAALLWAPELRVLAGMWLTDESLSHGPLVPIITLGLLAAHRDRLKFWRTASPAGLVALILAAIVYAAAVWADIDFLRPAALIGITLSAVWFLGGRQNLRAVVGPVCFLIFMIPWPTVIVDRLAFPLQLASSAYAALFAGILGVPIHREGVSLYVMPGPDAKPIYSIVVAQACSGLTSLMVLLALGYLIAYFTPVKAVWRMTLIAAVVPVALLCNATRLTVILLVGAHGNAALAKWIHDHEGPVLIFCCSSALMLLRTWLLAQAEGNAAAAPPRA